MSVNKLSLLLSASIVRSYCSLLLLGKLNIGRTFIVAHLVQFQIPVTTLGWRSYQLRWPAYKQSLSSMLGKHFVEATCQVTSLTTQFGHALIHGGEGQTRYSQSSSLVSTSSRQRSEAYTKTAPINWHTTTILLASLQAQLESTRMSWLSRSIWNLSAEETPRHVARSRLEAMPQCSPIITRLKWWVLLQWILNIFVAVLDRDHDWMSSTLGVLRATFYQQVWVSSWSRSENAGDKEYIDSSSRLSLKQASPDNFHQPCSKSEAFLISTSKSPLRSRGMWSTPRIHPICAFNSPT